MGPKAAVRTFSSFERVRVTKMEKKDFYFPTDYVEHFLCETKLKAVDGMFPH